MFYRSKTGNLSAEDVAKQEEKAEWCASDDLETGSEKTSCPTSPRRGVCRRICAWVAQPVVSVLVLLSCICPVRCLPLAGRRATGPDGFKSRNRNAKLSLCKIALLLLCFASAFIIMLTTYSLLFLGPRNPCTVAEESREFALSSAVLSKGMNESMLVPKIVHQQWKVDSEVPEKYQEWHAKWKALFPEPEYRHIMWSDDSARDLIAKHYAWFLDVYDGYEFNIQRADAARYFILHHFGGIYADLDYEPLQNFWHLIPKDRPGIIESPYQYNEYVQNSLMSSPAKHPFWHDVFRVLRKKAKAAVLKSTGPVLLDAAIAETPASWSYLPCELFHRIPLGESENSPFATLLHREILGRFYPMKSCGAYSDLTCQYGKHHNTAGYLKDTGIWKLVFS